MHKAPLQERIDFYRYSSASQLLDQAREILKEIQSLDRANTPDWKYNALWTAFYATYGKPFKQQRDKTLQIGLRLPDDVIPAAYKNEHDGIIDLRDKMFVHTDFASLTDDMQNPLNALAMHVIGRQPHFGLRYIMPTKSGIKKYLELLDAMIETVSYRGTKIWKRWAKHVNVPDNSVWSINAGNKSDDVLLKYK